jgi:hypothetical protein
LQLNESATVPCVLASLYFIAVRFFTQGDFRVMQLQPRLNELKQSFLASGKASPEMIGIMVRNTEQLRSSGILQRVLKAGQQAPSFELKNQDGQSVSSQTLLAEGPLIISFFRGVW